MSKDSFAVRGGESRRRTEFPIPAAGVSGRYISATSHPTPKELKFPDIDCNRRSSGCHETGSVALALS